MEATLLQGGPPATSGAQEQLFNTITTLTGDGLCLAEMITDHAGRAVDYRFLKINPKFENYTGLKDAEGHTARELVPELEDHWIDTYARVGLGRETLRFDNGSARMDRWFEVFASPGPEMGQLFILFRDVTARKTAESHHSDALERANRLLREVNHRVKNSLAIITSIISLEKRGADDTLSAALARVGNRVDAVKELYAALGDTDSVDTVDTGTYLSRVVEGLNAAVGRDDRVEIRSRIDDFPMDAEQAVSLGLVVNELVTNAVKHAFRPGFHGLIDVTLARGDTGTTTLCVEDNGGPQASPPDEGHKGLGSRLVAAFVENLDGRIKTDHGPTGTKVCLTF